MLGIAMGTTACGYRIRSSVGTLPENVQSLGIPTFQNLTNTYKVEQRITGAVLKEFNVRTRVPVVSKSTGVDALLLGEIRSISSAPTTFGDSSFGSAFMVTIQISAKIVRIKDSKIIWQDNSFLFQDRYAMNSNIRDFFSEDNPALDRLAHSFAASLVSTIIESQSLDSAKH